MAAGGIARAVLDALLPDLCICGYMVRIGPHGIDRTRFDRDSIDNNPFWSPDAVMVDTWSEYLLKIRKSGDSIGALIEIKASGVPAGLGRTGLWKAGQ